MEKKLDTGYSSHEMEMIQWPQVNQQPHKYLHNDIMALIQYSFSLQLQVYMVHLKHDKRKGKTQNTLCHSASLLAQRLSFSLSAPLKAYTMF